MGNVCDSHLPVDMAIFAKMKAISETFSVERASGDVTDDVVMRAVCRAKQ